MVGVFPFSFSAETRLGLNLLSGCGAAGEVICTVIRQHDIQDPAWLQTLLSSSMLASVVLFRPYRKRNGQSLRHTRCDGFKSAIRPGPICRPVTQWLASLEMAPLKAR